MMRAIPYIVLVVLSAGGSATADGPPAIAFHLDADRTYEGQPVTCTVSISNVSDAGRPEFQKSDDYEIAPLGGPTDHSSMKFFNGRTTSTSERTYRYRLIPRKTGKLVIPGPTLTVDGQVLEATDQSLEVLPATDQDIVYLEIAADRQSLYPMQEVTVTLTVSIKQLPAPFSEYEPVAVNTTPQLTIPWIDRRHLSPGIEHAEDPGDQLMRVRSRHGTGFRVNDIGVDSVFTLFGSHATAFHPKPTTVVRPNKEGIAARYWQYRFPQKFRATKPGTYTLGPASLIGRFGVSVNGQEELETEKIFTLSQQMPIRVEEIPQEGRPDSFVGAIGSFEATVELSPTKVQVRDPMTLEITLRGHGAFENVKPLDLRAVPAIAEHFLIHEAGQRSGDGFTTFSYDLRPLDAAIRQFPSIPLAYFDVNQEKYVVLKTEPINIEVADADSLTADQIVGPPRTEQPGEDDLEIRSEGVFANVTDLSAVRDESVRPAWWFAGLGGMAATYAVLAGVAVAAGRRNEDRSLLRRRRAPARARQRLREARAERSAGRLAAAVDAVCEGIVGLVADASNLPDAGMTSKDVRRHLTEAEIEDALVDRVVSLLDARDAARYGGSHIVREALNQEAEQVVEPLIRALKSKGKFR